MPSNKLRTKFREIYFKLYYPTFFRLVVWAKRKISRRFQFNRPSSYPYITGDGFRALAQHVFDDISNVDIKRVSDGDVIFVRSDMLGKFFDTVHKKINAKYILISHNADNNICEKKHLDDKIVHWFSQNLLFSDDKATPIPIGLINFRYSPDTALLKGAQRKSCEKKNKIILSFSEHMGRLAVKNKLINLETTDDLPKVNKSEYYEKIAEYKFVASPEGNGIDCHRTWEAMLLKSVPILIRNITTEFFESIGLPVLLINNWDFVFLIMVVKYNPINLYKKP